MYHANKIVPEYEMFRELFRFTNDGAPDCPENDDLDALAGIVWKHLKSRFPSDEKSSGFSMCSSPTEQLLLIRRAFGFSISELASIFDVTRPTIYSWFQGKDPKAGVLLKISKFSKIAEKLESLNIDRIDTFIHRPIFSGFSLVDKIKNNEDVTQFLETLKEISQKEVAARLVSKGSGKNREISNLNNDSIPFYRK